MSIVSSVEIQLLANVARLQTDMAAARKSVGDAMGGIESSIGVAKKAFGALGVALGVAGFASWIRGAIDAGDEAFKLSQKLGVATKDVAGLQLAFNLAGVGTDAMEKGLVKLSIQIANNSKTLAAFGIETRNADGSLRSTTTVLRDVADRFSAMTDGANKTALAVQLFGKAGAQMIPLLNAGADGLREMDEMAQKLGLSMDEKTARAAEQFNDTLELMGLAVSGVARQAVSELMPSLTNMAAGFLKAMTEGTALKTAAELLAVVLKSLFTAVMAVAEGLNTVSITASATWRAFMAATNGDFSKATEIIQTAGRDISAGWKNTSEVIQKAWSNSADSSITATAAIVGAARRNADASASSALAADENAKAVQRAANEYQKLTESLDKQLLSVQTEIANRGKLTDAQKLEIEVRAKLNDETVRLTAAQRAEIETKLAATVAAMNDRDAQRAADEARKKLTETIGKQNEDIVKQIEAQRRANAEAGLTTEQIARLEIQRLRDAAATASQNAQLRIQSGINDEVTKEYQEQAANLGKLAEEKEKGIHVQAAVQARNAWQETTKSIYDGLTDALMRAFESGKGFMAAFRDTLKNAFKTLVLEPTIRALMAPVAGALGGLFGGSPAGAATGGIGGGGGGGSGLLGTLGSIGGIGGMLTSGIGYGLAAYGSGATIMGSLAGAGSMLSGGLAAGSLGSIAAGLGAIVGTLGPIALGIGLLVKGFSRGPKQVTETGIEGTIETGAVDARRYSDWKKKGGWFRSNKYGTDYSALGADTGEQLNQTAMAVYDQARAYADALGLSVDALANVQYRIRVQLGQDEKANEKALSDAFDGYREALAASLGGALAPFQKAGETFAQTLERVATLQVFASDMNKLGGVFSRVAQLSLSAREELVGLAGGLEAFIAKAASFVQNYYSQDEQAGLQARTIQRQLEALGISSPLRSREDFRRLVESVDVSSAEGRKRLNDLLTIAQAFAPIGTYLENSGKTLDELAKAAPTTAILESFVNESELAARNAERTATAVELLNESILDIGSIISSAVNRSTDAILQLKTSVEIGQAEIASGVKATAKQLKDWDDNGSIVTTPAD